MTCIRITAGGPSALRTSRPYRPGQGKGPGHRPPSTVHRPSLFRYVLVAAVTTFACHAVAGRQGARAGVACPSGFMLASCTHLTCAPRFHTGPHRPGPLKRVTRQCSAANEQHCRDQLITWRLTISPGGPFFMLCYGHYGTRRHHRTGPLLEPHLPRCHPRQPRRRPTANSSIHPLLDP